MKVKSFCKVLITVLSMLALSLGQTVKADVVEIGNDATTSTTFTLPVNTDYNYSLTQQIYTAGEIGMAGNITAVSFKYAHTDALSMSGVKIYMKHVNKSEFVSSSDMVAVSASDLVYAGNFTAAGQGWTTINLDTPFAYNGTDNLLICCYDPTNGYPGSSFEFYTTYAGGSYMALGWYSTIYIPDLNNLTSFGGGAQRYSSRNNIRLNITASGMTDPTNAHSITLNDGTATNERVPVYGYWADQLTKSQFIIEDADLSTIQYCTIDTMTYYLSQASVDLGSAKFDVYLGEVNETAFGDATLVDWSTLEKVYSGSVTISDNMMKIGLDSPYQYLGGNLLVGFNQTTKGSYKTTTWYGVGATAAAVGGYNTSLNIQNFRPKVTFDYSPSSGVYRPTDLTATLTPGNGTIATLGWTQSDTATQWKLQYGTDSNFATYTEKNVSGTPSVNLTGLTAEQTYYARVKAISGGNESTWSNVVTFQPTNKVVIGSGTETTNIVPTSSSDKYSLTQQIYTASEIGKAGNISSVDFNNVGTTLTRNFDIYLVHTSKAMFSGQNDWITVSANDKVFSGNVTMTSGGWTTIDFDTPFAYDGINNLALIVDDNTGTGTNGINCRVFEASGKALTKHNSTTNFDPTSPPNEGDNLSYWRNQIRLGITASGVTDPTDAHSLTLNDGAVTNGRVPIYGYWADAKSKSQFIIKADDLSTIANTSIDSLTFYAEGSDISWGDAEFEVYMTEVSDTTFDSPTLLDWASMDKVKAADSLSVVNGKMVVVLDSPYSYMGGNLLIGFLQTKSGSYKSVSWYGVEATGAAVGGYDTSLNIQNFRPKVTFFYTPGTAPTCSKPRAVTVSDVTDESAVVSWTSDASAWTLRYRAVGASTWTTVNVTTTSYTITGLNSSTEYEVQVQTNCGGGDTSDWTNIISFQTMMDSSIATDNIAYNLVDSYGDGWNGASIRVVNHNTGSVVAELTVESGSSAEGTLELVCGEDYDFVWVGGSYDEECSYVFYDINGDEIFSGSGSMSSAVSYTMDCTITTCKKPTSLRLASSPAPRSVELEWTPGSNDQTTWDIAYKADGDADFTIVEAVTENPYTLTGLETETDYTVKVRGNCGGGEVSKWSKEITFTTNTATPTPVVTEVVVAPNTAEISWSGWADEYELRYALSPSLTPTNETLLQYDNDNFSTTYGGSSEETWTWGVMYPGSLVTGNSLTGISIYEANSKNTGDITINIYEGGDNAPGNLLYSETVTPEALDDFHDIEFKSPVFLTPGQNLWITLTETGTYVLNVCDDGSEPNNQWIYYGGAWNKIADLVSANVGWMIRGNMATIDFNSDNITWTTVTCDEATALLTGLQAETDYIVQVRGNYGTDGYSAWCTGVFTTKAGTEEPFNLATTVITPASATLNWTGYQNSYNVQYRKKEVASPTESATIILTAGDIWGDGSGYQMLLDADATAYGTIIPNEGGLTGGGDVSDDTYAEFEYKIPENADGVLTTENIVLNNSISIQIPAGTYDFCITNPTAGDRMWIVAHTGNVPGRYDDFVFEPGTTYEFTISYNGTNDGVDLTETLPMGDWITVNNVTNPYQLTGLTPETYYEWQVQGILDGGTTGWSAISNFTTKSTSYDLNGDGNVGFADVATLANIVVGNISQAGYPMTVIDINNDGVISVADVTAFVNMLKAMP